MDPQQPVTRVNTIEDLLADSVAPSRFNMVLLLGLALCAVLLAVVGVYGVVSYTVSRRTRELGVRMALGASSRSAVGLVLTQAVRVVAGGAAVGVVVALASGRVLRGLLYGVEPVDPATYAMVVAITLAVGLLAAAVPARACGPRGPRGGAARRVAGRGGRRGLPARPDAEVRLGVPARCMHRVGEGPADPDPVPDFQFDQSLPDNFDD